MAGTLLAASVVAATVLATAAAVPVLGALTAQRGASAAADASALAAADTLSGRVAGYPCENAERIAALDGARLTSCELDGSIAAVAVSKPYLAFTLAARARAGPPGSH